MRVRGKGVTLVSGGVSSPPEPCIEVSDDEGAALIGRGLAVDVDTEGGEAPVAGLAEPETPSAAEPEEAAEEAPAESPSAEPAETPAEDASASDAAPEASAESAPEAEASGETPAPTRAEIISEVFDILEPDDLVKTGERAGRPKVSAIEAATGFDDVTADEVDALWAKRDESPAAGE